MNFKHWFENLDLPGVITIKIDGTGDQPYLTSDEWGYIKLFYDGEQKFYTVHMIQGKKPGAGSVLYFAALWWLIKQPAIKGGLGQLGSDTVLSPDAYRARQNFENRYKDYLYTIPSQKEVKLHNGTSVQSNVWRLRKEPPMEFTFEALN